MSPSEPGPRVNLHVVAEDRASQVVVLDSSLVPVAKGVHFVTVDLPPGIYKVRAITAGQVREQFADLEAEKVYLKFPQIEFASPAPLRQTAGTSPEQMEAADAHSHRIHVDLQGSSEIYLFIHGGDASQLAAGVTLAREDGTTVVSFDQAGARGGDGDAWYACNVALAPGAYRLIAQGGRERLAQTVVASEGWQTQVFLRREREEGALDMANAAVFMARRQHGFHPGEEMVRVTELARIGLSDRRRILPPEDMDFLAWGKFENPILGLLAAHLLLLPRPADQRSRAAREADDQLLRLIVKNLRKLLGAHPDVEALELVTGVPAPGTALPPFRNPPMLLRSYWLIVEHSADHPELVPSGSILAEIATDLWGGAGPWLVFSQPGQRPRTPAPQAFSAPLAARSSLDELIDRIAPADLQRLAAAPAELTPAEEAVLHYVSHPRRRARPLRSPGPPAASTRFDVRQMVAALGLPPVVIYDALSGLSSKAGQLPPPRGP